MNRAPRAAPARHYVRAAPGRHARRRRAWVWGTQLVYFGLPWLHWNGRPALLADLGAARFYCFGLVLGPPDLVYLAGAAIAAVLALCLAAALVERPWCGYACPHTVYFEMFLWIERLAEGSPGARLRRERTGPRAPARARKALKHAAWIVLAGCIGFTLAGYFAPVRALAARLVAGALAPWELGVMLAYGALAYGNAGWMGARFCRYICPHARFQGALQDRATLVIRYDAARGEPRGPRRRQQGARAPGGDCVDCTLCVQVCPTGIDIRHGVQYDCIGCGACIDACDAVMDKLGAARGLVGYAAAAPGGRVRARVLLYAAALAGVVAALAYALGVRAELRLDVMHDRAVWLRAASDGALENVYRLHVANSGTGKRRYRIAATGIVGLAPVPAGVELAPGEARVLALTLRSPAGAAPSGASPIRIALHEDSAAPAALAAAVFLAPPGGSVPPD
jgi:cytochrome c oxidase accessory protein FixG